MPACCENGPICSCEKRSNTSLDSHTSTTRIPSSVLAVQWEMAPGGMFPEVRPINSTILSYCSRVAPLKFISIATGTVSPFSVCAAQTTPPGVEDSDPWRTMRFEDGLQFSPTRREWDEDAR